MQNKAMSILLNVVPAINGIQILSLGLNEGFAWIPAFAGTTGWLHYAPFTLTKPTAVVASSPPFVVPAFEPGSRQNSPLIPTNNIAQVYDHL